MKSLETLLPTFEKLNTRWKQCANEPTPELLRLAVLRELHSSSHARQSHFLATTQAEKARAIQNWESRIEATLTLTLTQRSLQATEKEDMATFLAGMRRKAETIPPLPLALFHVIEKDRLERLDRAWEKAIAARACALQWRFWKLTAQVVITQVERWNRSLTEFLWPKGIILYSESGELTNTKTSHPGWQGNWILLLPPHEVPETLQTPAKTSDVMNSWLGTVGPPPQWTLLFDPQAKKKGKK